MIPWSSSFIILIRIVASSVLYSWLWANYDPKRYQLDCEHMTTITKGGVSQRVLQILKGIYWSFLFHSLPTTIEDTDRRMVKYIQAANEQIEDNLQKINAINAAWIRMYFVGSKYINLEL